MPGSVGFSINLESLIDLSAKLNQTFDDDFILNSALLSLMGKLRILRACFLVPCNRIALRGGVPVSEIEPGCHYIVKFIKGKTPDIKVPVFFPKSFRELNMNSPGESILFDNGYRYTVPIVYQDTLLGIVCLGPRYDNKPITDEEILYINLVSTITAGALNGSESNRSLIEAKNSVERRNLLLSSLFEISREFNTFLSRSQIIKILSYRLMGQLMVSRYAIYLKDRHKKYERIANRFEKSVHIDVLRELENLGAATLTDGLSISSSAAAHLAAAGIVLVAPMSHQGENKGLMLLGKKMNTEPFTDENFQFIEALGNISISALENERLFVEEIEKKRLEEEMHIAMNIQKNLLPKTIPYIEGYGITGLNIPSQMVGGDYYDIIPLPENRTMIAIADVAGKGAPAALLMANVQAALRVLAPLCLSLHDMIERLNRLVFMNTTPDRFITLFLGTLDPATHTFSYISAGHNPPLYYYDGKFHRLTEGGIILGILEKPSPWESGTLNFDKGGVLVFFTDGVTEALNANSDEYGEDRLKEVITSHHELSPAEITGAILGSVRQHSEGEMQSDDITIIVLKSENN